MNHKHTYDSLRQERLRIHTERMKLLAQIEQWKREAETLLMYETDLMRMQDTMQVQAQMAHVGTEMRQ